MEGGILFFSSRLFLSYTDWLPSCRAKFGVKSFSVFWSRARYACWLVSLSDRPPVIIQAIKYKPICIDIYEMPLKQKQNRWLLRVELLNMGIQYSKAMVAYRLTNKQPDMCDLVHLTHIKKVMLQYILYQRYDMILLKYHRQMGRWSNAFNTAYDCDNMPYAISILTFHTNT